MRGEQRACSALGPQACLQDVATPELPLLSVRGWARVALFTALLPALTGCAAGSGGGSASGDAPEPAVAAVAPGAGVMPVGGAGLPAVGMERPGGNRLAAMLEPPEAAVRAAGDTELNGRELGTMWTFENAPVDQWRERYGFDATPEWLEHVRLASVRFGEICSASFVSATGLVMTNHHCARDCIEAVSTAQIDYVVEGFQAAELSDELQCPDLYLDQLVEIEDVTPRVRSAAPPAAGSRELAEAQGAEARRIEEECAQRSGNECQVVPLFQGGQFQLYTYQRYAPVKLVFAPELQAGFFGGDPDNFTYPRYNLDVAFVRAYEPDGATPAETPHFFAWDPDGADEDELVFITGNPGSTSRLITVAQLMYERSYRHPFIIGLLEAQRRMLQTVAAQGPQQERAVRDDLFSVENSLKAYSGQLRGLLDPGLVATKIVWEEEFRGRLMEIEAARRYADVWAEMADIQARKIEASPVVNAANSGLMGAPQLTYAASLVRYLQAGEGPEVEQLGLTEIREFLEEPTDVPEVMASAPFEAHLEMAHAWLPADHPLREALFRTGEDPADAASRLTRDSRILDVEFRRAMLAEGAGALDTTTDPLLTAVVMMEAIYPEALSRWQSIVAEENLQKGRLAEALFAVYGTDLPPDATFTLRISDGVVSRYAYNGTFAPPKTTYYGLYARAADFDDAMPWSLPRAFGEARERVDMSTPLNFVSTNDITGGNSGSPMIDRDTRVVGIAFDGNVEQLPNEFLFRTDAGRTVAVHSAGILEALRNVYQAESVVAELLEGSR